MQYQNEKKSEPNIEFKNLGDHKIEVIRTNKEGDIVSKSKISTFDMKAVMKIKEINERVAKKSNLSED